LLSKTGWAGWNWPGAGGRPAPSSGASSSCCMA